MKGVKAIGIVAYDHANLVVNTNTGVVDLPLYMTDTPAIARLEVRATGNTFAETGTLDEATRTSEFVGVNTFFLNGNDLELRNSLQGVAGNLQVVFVEDYNGKVYCVGSQNGCDVMTVEGGTDTQGFKIIVNSKEAELMYELSTAGIAVYNDALLAY